MTLQTTGLKDGIWFRDQYIDQFPYRSKLAGLLGTDSMITEIVQTHQLPRVAKTIACDRIFALHQALGINQHVSYKDPDHDIIFAIRNKMR